MSPFKGLFSDVLNLFYPRICAVCNNNLLHGENLLCTHCLADLPRTRFHNDFNNPVSQMFWGRVYLQQATALYFFKKGSRYQDLVHHLKYNGRKDIGLYLGNMLGAELSETAFYSDVDFIIPVPLHPKREKKRGYNQSTVIANGMAEQMKKPVQTNILLRKKETETQTKKSRDERIKNMENTFVVDPSPQIFNKHFLLVDDVVTTGATLESCAAALLEIPGSRVSIACLACVVM